jgi:hypothetical protein
MFYILNVATKPWIKFDAPPSSLMDSTTNPKVNKAKGERVGARSLAHNTLRVEGRVGASGLD